MIILICDILCFVLFFEREREGQVIDNDNHSFKSWAIRKVIWPLVLGIEERIQQYPNHYQALVELGGSTEETASQIAKVLFRINGENDLELNLFKTN